MQQRMRTQETKNTSTAELTEQYVYKKLSYLLPEISTKWPRLYLGAKEFFQGIPTEQGAINIGIVSSGHTDFIRKVFEVNDIPLPDIIVTSDILRLRPMPKRERYKPYPYQLAEVHRLWKKLPSKDGVQLWSHEPYTERAQGKPNMAYIGDDPIKDGGLAEQARIPFIFVPFTKPVFKPNAEKGQLGITDFFQLRDLLDSHMQELREKESFASIIFGKKDSELFPPLTEQERPYNVWLTESRTQREREF
jgi:hypothetical protein